jgi:hypothetical protein
MGKRDVLRRNALNVMFGSLDFQGRRGHAYIEAPKGIAAPSYYGLHLDLH